MHFHCVRSTGTAKFNVGDGVITTQNIEMSFRIICYVPSYVKQDAEIQTQIINKTCTAIEDAIQTREISMMDVFSSVQARMSDYIDHFTLLGINENVENQTFTIVSEDAQPSIRRVLVLNADNVISLEKEIDIEFVSLEDYQASLTTIAAPE